ncbi:fungal-specific transcription factor domain-containing protein [Dactylonectria macrodidyma]|uniref:Fungal-specific transcription factor domain-containing protein n=1 Tax=Dactylonectria macrodidyma TaxID=307937 RepID=A0A9P9EM71_9HYPO|nr:fungal-specific transcription factor domain-containing protein [Dactylonectria macrodidyma]
MSEGSAPSLSPQPPSGSDSGSALSPLSCYLCKTRKLRCDRTQPGCGRCAKAGEYCDYPSARKRPVMPVTRSGVRDLKAKIQELEGRLEAQNTSPESGYSNTELIDTGRFDQLPPPHIVEELMSIYFTKLQSDSLMIHQQRYVASLYRPAHMQPPMCLQYAILAAGASASSMYRHFADAFYGRARQYIQTDEMKNDSHQISLAHVQAWVLISHFEAQHLWFSRASMSIARAIRLGQILGLHRLDGKNAAGLTLPPATDFTEEEERRKTFWVIFCTDRITSSTGGWPTMMDARSIQTRLPTPMEAFLYSIPVASITLRQALKQDMWELSTSACRVVAVHLFNECFNFSRGGHDDDDADSDTWQQLQQLDNSLTNAFETLPFHLRCPENMDNADAVFINLQLHTALICIYRAATTRSQMDMGSLPHIHERVSVSAVKIMTIVALVADIATSSRNPLISFATYIAASFFLTDFVASGNRQSEENLTALTDLMIDVGKTNAFTASLAVRLAQALTTSGVDPRAVEKVEMLMADLTIPGQEDEENGIVILCPATGQPNHADFGERLSSE